MAFLLGDLTIAKSSLMEFMNHKSAESYHENRKIFCAVLVSLANFESSLVLKIV